MSNIVWSADKGWHDGAPVTVTAVAGRIVTAPAHTTHVASDQDTATLFDTDPGMLEAFIVNAEPSLFTA